MFVQIIDLSHQYKGKIGKFQVLFYQFTKNQSNK